MSPSFGWLLGNLRIQRGMTVVMLAKKLDIDPSYITRLEKGHRRAPGFQLVARIASALDLSQASTRALEGATLRCRLASSLEGFERPALVLGLAEQILVMGEDLSEKQLCALQEVIATYDAAGSASSEVRQH